MQFREKRYIIKTENADTIGVNNQVDQGETQMKVHFLKGIKTGY